MTRDIKGAVLSNAFITKNIPYNFDKYGFLTQDIDSREPYCYTPEYACKQATTNAMTWLRMGWLSAHLSKEQLAQFCAVDIGAGNGLFVKEAQSLFFALYAYDVVPGGITKEQLLTTSWDIIFLTDVLEHFDDIDSLWDLSFDYAFISFPETPCNFPLDMWRHTKYNEHLYLLNSAAFKSWAEKHGYEVVAAGCPEDMIRRRWDADCVNISTFLIKRTGVVINELR